MAFRHVIIRDQDGQSFPVTNETPAAQFGASLQGQGWTLVSTTGSATAPTQTPDTTTPDTTGTGIPNEFPNSKGITIELPGGPPTVMRNVQKIEHALRPIAKGGLGGLATINGEFFQFAESDDDLTGTTRRGRIIEAPGGGLLINGLPINAILDPTSVTREQAIGLRDMGLSIEGLGPPGGFNLPPIILLQALVLPVHKASKPVILHWKTPYVAWAVRAATRTSSVRE
jgi:hypothetical protein